MVFGFLKGKINVTLNKTVFVPGDTIEGTAALKLRKSVKARRFMVSLIGTEKTRERRPGESTDDINTQEIYRFDVDLDGEKEYQSSGENTYEFKIKTPPDILGSIMPTSEGVVGGILRTAKYLQNLDRQLFWHIQTRLDVPLGFDVTKQTQITITQ